MVEIVWVWWGCNYSLFGGVIVRCIKAGGSRAGESISREREGLGGAGVGYSQRKNCCDEVLYVQFPLLCFVGFCEDGGNWQI